MRYTDIQYYVLEIVVNGNDEGEYTDMTQLIELLESRHGYKTTRDNIQFTLRRLEKEYDLIKRQYEIRRGRRRSVLRPTVEGIKLLVQNPWDK